MESHPLGCWVLWPECSFDQTLLAFALIHLCWRLNLPVTSGIYFLLLTLAFQSPVMKRTFFFFLVLVLEGLQVFIELVNFSFFSISDWGINLDKLETISLPDIDLKLWVMPCRATQDGWVIVKSSDEMWSTGEGNGNPLQYSCLKNPMDSLKK